MNQIIRTTPTLLQVIKGVIKLDFLTDPGLHFMVTPEEYRALLYMLKHIWKNPVDNLSVITIAPHDTFYCMGNVWPEGYIPDPLALIRILTNAILFDTNNPFNEKGLILLNLA